MSGARRGATVGLAAIVIGTLVRIVALPVSDSPSTVQLLYVTLTVPVPLGLKSPNVRTVPPLWHGSVSSTGTAVSRTSVLGFAAVARTLRTKRRPMSICP